MRSLVVDLETMGRAPSGAIVQIGAVIVEDYKEIIDTFFANVDLDTSIDLGMTVNSATIMWWLEQEDAAIKALIPSRHHISVALTNLATFYFGCSEIWSHGGFDLPILDYAYEKASKKFQNVVKPWHYRDERDLRTLYTLAGGRPTLEEIEEAGDIPHISVTDAKHMARELIICKRRIGGVIS